MINKIKSKLAELTELSKIKMPDSVKNSFEARNFDTFIHQTGREPVERAYTPLVKRLIASDKRIPFTAGLLPQERKYICVQIDLLFKNYGQPVFDYSKVSEDKGSAVDCGQALTKMSPLSTIGAAQRRYENTMKYLEPTRFKPEPRLFSQAFEYTLEQLQEYLPSKVEPIKKDAIDAAGPFKALSSNVGFPFYKNERTIDKDTGKSYRQKSYEKTLEGLERYGYEGIMNVPATIIGRSQNAGIDITLGSDVAALKKEVLEKKDILLPSKERPVFAISRCVNNTIAPMIHPVIDALKSNPIFCAFLSKPERKDIMRKFDLTGRMNKLVAGNVDYKSYDVTESKEMLVAGGLMLCQIINMSAQQERIFGAFMTNTIFTPFYCLNPKTDKIEYFKTDGTMPSGSLLTNLVGGIINLLNRNYCMIKMYGFDFVKDTDRKFILNSTYPAAVAGDDLNTGLRSFTDLKSFSQIAHDAFGFVIPTDGVKTQGGTMFLKERYVEQTDSINFPTPAVTVKCLGVERPKGLNGTLGDLGFASKLENMKDNRDLYDTVNMLQALDSTLLGLLSPDGEEMKPSSFRAATANECAKYGNTPLEVVGDGNPSKSVNYDSKGMPTSIFLDGYFGILNDALKDRKMYSFLCSLFDVAPVFGGRINDKE